METYNCSQCLEAQFLTYSNLFLGLCWGNRLPLTGLVQEKTLLHLAINLPTQSLFHFLVSLALSVLLWLLPTRASEENPPGRGPWPPGSLTCQAGRAFSGAVPCCSLCRRHPCPPLLGTFTYMSFSHFGHPTPNHSPTH